MQSPIMYKATLQHHNDGNLRLYANDNGRRGVTVSHIYPNVLFEIMTDGATDTFIAGDGKRYIMQHIVFSGVDGWVSIASETGQQVATIERVIVEHPNPDTLYGLMGIAPDTVTYLITQDSIDVSIPIPNVNNIPALELKKNLENVPLSAQADLQAYWQEILQAIAAIPVGERLEKVGDFRLKQDSSWTVVTNTGQLRRFDIGWHSGLGRGVLRVYRNGIASMDNDSNSTVAYQHGRYVFAIDHAKYKALASDIVRRHKFDNRTQKESA